MNKRETVQAFVDSIQKGDFENAKSMLADDFQFSGPVPLKSHRIFGQPIDNPVGDPKCYWVWRSILPR